MRSSLEINLPVISSIFITVIDCTQVLDIEPLMNMKERRVKDNRVSILSGEDQFALTEIDVNPYIDVFHSALKNAGKIEIRYQGVSASPNCIVIQGFPTSDTLERLRNELRTQLTEAGVRVTFDSRYKLVTAHSSIIRFKAPLNDAQQLLALCQRYRNHDFGRVVLEDFELVFNNWYQNLDVTMSLAKYRVQ